MGCGGSKEDGLVMQINVGDMQVVQSQSSPDLQKRQGGFDAFNAMEEEDERALQVSDTLLSKVAQGMGVALPEGRASFVVQEETGTFEEEMRHFAAVFANMPLEAPGTPSGLAVDRMSLPAEHIEAWGRWRKLDEKHLPPTAANDLLESLLLPECPALPKRIVFRILLDACARLHECEPVVAVPAPLKPTERQVIVGDTHGQLQDVLHIFLTHGVPSSTNRYIFNGDVADRGPNAIEIFMLILLFQQTVPESTWLTRGNHEARDINERPAASGGGFRDEVLAKYDEETFELFQLLFLQLPVAAVVGTQIFVIHGGLSRERETPLEALKALDHRRNIPQRPYGREECIIFDSLWADPQEEDGIEVGGRGDDTIKWGPDVTDEFLKGTGLELIVRSHQVPAGRRGFGLHHNSKVITVFSASNYAGVCMNRGGVLIVPASGSVAIEEHMALTLEELRKAHRKDKKMTKRSSKAAQLSANEANMLLGWRARAHEHASVRRTRDLKAELQGRMEMEDDEQDAAQERLIDNLLVAVRTRICEHQPRLHAALLTRHSDLCALGKASANGRKLVSLTLWRDVLDNVLGLRLDWSTMPDRFQEGLSAIINDPKPGDDALHESLYPAVDFIAFLDRFYVAIRDEPGKAASSRASSSSSQATQKLNPHLLAVVHSQSLAFRKALILSSTNSGEHSPAPVSGRPNSSRNKFATVGLAEFISAIENLASAVEQAHTFRADDFVAVAAAVPADASTGRLLFHRFLDSLYVVDSLAPAYASSSGPNLS